MRNMEFDHAKKQIILNRGFYKKANNPKNREFRELLENQQHFPHYQIVEREPIRQNSSKECYRGLTYEYMRNYIQKYEPLEKREQTLKVFDHIIDITKCHSKGYRYPIVKKWFLKRYPEIKEHGVVSMELEYDLVEEPARQEANTEPARDQKDIEPIQNEIQEKDVA